MMGGGYFAKEARCQEHRFQLEVGVIIAVVGSEGGKNH